MLTDWELWACAQHHIREYDFDAPIFVALRMDELLEAGDVDGVATYRVILEHTRALLARPTDAAALN